MAFTRGIENLYIVETKEHKIWEVLGVLESKKRIFEQTSSTDESWVKEADRLRKLGKKEQVKGIENKLKTVQVSKKNVANLEELKKEALNPDKFNKKAKDKLFEIAKKENSLDILEKLVELKYKKAERYLKETNQNTKRRKENTKGKYQTEINIGFNKIKYMFPSKEIALNLVYDELSVAKYGNKFAQNFVKNSGIDTAFLNEFKLSDLSEDMYYQVDKIQSVILEYGMSFMHNRNKLASIKIGIIDKVMKDFRIGKYESYVDEQLLLNSGANPNLQAKEGATALIFASQNGHREIVELLLNSGANPNFQNKEGFTALIFASQNEHREIVELLLENGANSNLQAIDGFTALIFASQNGHREIVELLLKNSANPNFQNKEGATALSFASQEGYREIVELLLNSGANLNLQTNSLDSLENSEKGKTALQIAKHNNHHEIVQLLLEAGAKE